MCVYMYVYLSIYIYMQNRRRIALTEARAMCRRRACAELGDEVQPVFVLGARLSCRGHTKRPRPQKSD